MNRWFRFFAAALLSSTSYVYWRVHVELNDTKLKWGDVQQRKRSFSMDHSVTLNGWQAHIESLAKQSGVTTIKNINKIDNPNNPTIELGWEATLSNSHRFMVRLEQGGVLGSCQRMEFSPSSTGNNLLLVRAVFDTIARSRTHVSERDNAPIRNVFISVVSPVLAATASANHAEVARKAREEQERKEIAQAERTAYRKKQFEETYVLSGIANDGRQSLAFVHRRNSAGSMMTWRAGDMIDGIRVASIDAQLGEMTCALDGAMEIRFRIGNELGAIQ